MAGGDDDERQIAANEARARVEDAVVTTRRTQTRASRGTTIQSEIADKGGRYVTAQAEMAQAVAMLVGHIPAQVDHLLGLPLPMPLLAPNQLYSEVPGISPNPRGPGGEAQPAYRTRAINELTQLATKNLMSLVASIQAEADLPGADIFASHEKAADTARNSVEKLQPPGGLAPTRTCTSTCTLK